MPSLRLTRSRWAAFTFAVLPIISPIPALDVEYCSDLNTATGDPAFWQFQSNGWCHDHCVSKYAFAIVQGYNCWCSDYAPGITSSSSNCNTKCPGYDELCGGNGYYGYIALGQVVAGTIGAPDSTVSSPPVQQVTVTASGPVVTASGATVTEIPIPVTIFSTVTPTSSQISSTSYTLFPSTSDLSPSTTSSSYSTSLTWTPTPVTSVETVTGQVLTITTTPTAPPTASDNSGAFEETTSHGLSTGQAVGLTVGLVALIVIVVATVFFIWKRRQSAARDQIDDGGRGDSASGPLPKRTMSENSRYMLGTDGKRVVEGWEEDNEGAAGSRRSRLRPVDPRLDPYAPPYQRRDGSKSRDSMDTIRDDRDYSRRVHVPFQPTSTLRTTNPDG